MNVRTDETCRAPSFTTTGLSCFSLSQVHNTYAITESQALCWELFIPVDDDTAMFPYQLGHAPAFPLDIGVEQELRMVGCRLHLAVAAAAVNKGCSPCCKAGSASWPWRLKVPPMERGSVVNFTDMTSCVQILI